MEVGCLVFDLYFAVLLRGCIVHWEVFNVECDSQIFAWQRLPEEVVLQRNYAMSSCWVSQWDCERLLIPVIQSPSCFEEIRLFGTCLESRNVSSHERGFPLENTYRSKNLAVPETHVALWKMSCIDCVILKSNCFSLCLFRKPGGNMLKHFGFVRLDSSLQTQKNAWRILYPNFNSLELFTLLDWLFKCVTCLRTSQVTQIYSNSTVPAATTDRSEVFLHTKLNIQPWALGRKYYANTAYLKLVSIWRSWKWTKVISICRGLLSVFGCIVFDWILPISSGDVFVCFCDRSTVSPIITSTYCKVSWRWDRRMAIKSNGFKMKECLKVKTGLHVRFITFACVCVNLCSLRFLHLGSKMDMFFNSPK